MHLNKKPFPCFVQPQLPPCNQIILVRAKRARNKVVVFHTPVMVYFYLFVHLFRLVRALAKLTQQQDMSSCKVPHTLAQMVPIQYNTIQCNAMRCNAMQCDAMQCDAMQCNAMRCNAMRCNAIQYNTIQHNTIQYNTIQRTKSFSAIVDISQLGLGRCHYAPPPQAQGCFFLLPSSVQTATQFVNLFCFNGCTSHAESSYARPLEPPVESYHRCSAFVYVQSINSPVWRGSYILVTMLFAKSGLKNRIHK